MNLGGSMNFVKQHKNIIFSFSINAVVFILFLLFSSFHYDMADTMVFSEHIASGDNYIIFTNYLLCWLAGVLQKLIYPVNAYVLIELIVSFIAFCAITYVLTDKFNSFCSGYTTIVLYAFFGVNHYATASFTLTAALLSVSGLFCLFHFVMKDKSIIGIIVGIVLSVFGSMYRFNVFITVFFIFGLYYIVYNLVISKSKFSLKMKKFFNLKFIVAFILLITCAFSCKTISSFVYNFPEMQYYSEYTSARSNVYDYYIPTYSEAKADYDKIGVSENDLVMLQKLYMDDEGAFSIEKLKSIDQVKSKYYKSISLFTTVKNMVMIEGLDALFGFNDKGMLIWIFAIALIILLITMKKRYYFIPLVLLFGVGVIYLYLWIIQRCVYRVVYGPVFAAVLCMIYSINVKDIREWVKKFYNKMYSNITMKKRVYAGFLAFVLFFSAVVLPISFHGNLYIEGASSHPDGYDEMISYIKSNPDKKFEFSKVSMPTVKNQYEKPLIINIPNSYKNTITFDGTYYRDISSNKAIKDFGANNLYRNLINNNNVYFVDLKQSSDMKYFEIYLNEHYSKDNTIKMIPVKTIGSYTFYSVKTDS